MSINKEILRLLICRECGCNIDTNVDQLICYNCGLLYPIVGGIVDLRHETAYEYSFEYSPEETKKLAVLADKIGWFEALKKMETLFGSDWNDHFVSYNASEKRTPWIDMLSGNHDATVMDFGSGLGAISINLAHRYASIISVDVSIERLQFIKIRAQQENLYNIHTIAWDGLQPLPFRHGSFDNIVLNGVLEWVPESIKDGEPKSIQLQLLKSLYALLKPHGKLLLAIENRYALQYWLGIPDRHSDIRYITIMPRILADIYSRIIRKRPYRAYTHSLKCYLNLLKMAGFTSIETFEAFPSYQFPKVLVPIHSERMIRQIHSKKLSFENAIIVLSTYFGLAKLIIFTYCFCAVKE